MQPWSKPWSTYLPCKTQALKGQDSPGSGDQVAGLKSCLFLIGHLTSQVIRALSSMTLSKERIGIIAVFRVREDDTRETLCKIFHIQMHSLRKK